MKKATMFLAMAFLGMAASQASAEKVQSHCWHHLSPQHCNDDRTGQCYWDYNQNRCLVRQMSCYQIYDYYQCINSPMNCFWDDYTNSCQPNY